MAKYAPQVDGLFPIVISQDEYDRDWKPHGWKLIVIGPTSTWREEWGYWEAIRDIVQNCLDEAEAYSYGYDDRGLWIADKGKGVAVSDFLLGPPKLKPDWARGKFGEGMKIACLALLRQGHPVLIQTVNREVRVIFTQQQVNGKVKTLAALWKPNGSRAGTRFHIIGYNGSAYAEKFAVNLPRGAILAEVPSPITQPKQRYNQLIRAEGMAASVSGGVIYVRDIYLMDIHSRFSYNLWGFELAPDRHGPKKEVDMWTDMGRLWAGIKKVPLLVEFIKMVADIPLRVRTTESMSVNMGMMGREPTSGERYSGLMIDNAPFWQQAWERAVGEAKVVRTNDRLDSMVIHLGYQSVSVEWSVKDQFSNVIKTDKELIREMSERLSEADVIPDRELTSNQLAHLELARAIAEDFGQVGTIKAAIIPPASDMVARTAGFYEFDTGNIKISSEMLQSASETVGVMVHELGHHMAYKRLGSKELAGDLTTGHTDAMEYSSGRIFQKLAQGNYDEPLKKSTWY